MTLERHAYHLGSLVGNFQSLEFSLRAFLQNRPDARPLGIPPGKDLYSSSVGDELPESELTSYDSLGTLIEKYNSLAAKAGLSQVDCSLVDIRDALAHGRVSAELSSDQLRLIKYSKPQNGRVKVLFNALLTEEWFSEQKGRTVEALRIVHTAAGQSHSEPDGSATA